MMTALIRAAFVLVVLALSFAARAQLTIEITGAGANRIPIAIADFAGEPGVARAVSMVVRADLERSGLFKLVEAGPPLVENAPVNFADWKSRGADALVVGSVQQTANGSFEVRFRLHDVQKQASLGGWPTSRGPTGHHRPPHRRLRLKSCSAGGHLLDPHRLRRQSAGRFELDRRRRQHECATALARASRSSRRLVA